MHRPLKHGTCLINFRLIGQRIDLGWESPGFDGIAVGDTQGSQTAADLSTDLHARGFDLWILGGDAIPGQQRLLNAEFDGDHQIRGGQDDGNHQSSICDNVVELVSHGDSLAMKAEPSLDMTLTIQGEV
jgi:hypothetical protein